MKTGVIIGIVAGVIVISGTIGGIVYFGNKKKAEDEAEKRSEQITLGEIDPELKDIQETEMTQAQANKIAKRIKMFKIGAIATGAIIFGGGAGQVTIEMMKRKLKKGGYLYRNGKAYKIQK